MKTRIRFYDSRSFPYIRFVRGENVTHAFSRHVHGTFIIGRVDSGSRVIRKAGSEAVIPEGCLFVLNPSEPHSCMAGDGKFHSYTVLAVPAGPMAHVVSRIVGRSVSSFRFSRTSLPDYQELTSAFSRLEKAFTSDPENQDISIVFESMIFHLIRLSGISDIPATETRGRKEIDRVVNVIESCYSDTLSLGGLSRIAGLSPFHFQREFLNVKGITPHEYLVRQRMKTGVTLLQQGWPIAKTAAETGFSDQSHFTRVFKKYVGITPGFFAALNVKES